MASAVHVQHSYPHSISHLFRQTNPLNFLANSSAQGSGKFPQKVDDVLEEETTGRDLKLSIVCLRDIIACFAFTTSIITSITSTTSILLFVTNLARLCVNLILVEMFAPSSLDQKFCRSKSS